MLFFSDDCVVLCLFAVVAAAVVVAAVVVVVVAAAAAAAAAVVVVAAAVVVVGGSPDTFQKEFGGRSKRRACHTRRSSSWEGNKSGLPIRRVLGGLEVGNKAASLEGAGGGSTVASFVVAGGDPAAQSKVLQREREGARDAPRCPPRQLRTCSGGAGGAYGGDGKAFDLSCCIAHHRGA